MLPALPAEEEFIAVHGHVVPAAGEGAYKGRAFPGRRLVRGRVHVVEDQAVRQPKT